ncbi:MAG: hypothetical protein ABIM42_01880 [candidate division WOR-3 bacterium]
MVFVVMTPRWNLLGRMSPILKLYSELKLRIKVRRTLAEYNRYRYPEVKADIVSFSKGEIRIVFSGPFCRTCGFYDYFEDYGVILEKAGIKVEISKVEEFENGAIVLFKILA